MVMATELGILSGLTALLVGSLAVYHFVKLTVKRDYSVKYWLVLGIALTFGCGGLSKTLISLDEMLVYLGETSRPWLVYEPVHLLLRFGSLSGLILHFRTFTYAWAGIWAAASLAMALFVMFLVMESF